MFLALIKFLFFALFLAGWNWFVKKARPLWKNFLLSVSTSIFPMSVLLYIAIVRNRPYKIESGPILKKSEVVDVLVKNRSLISDPLKVMGLGFAAGLSGALSLLEGCARSFFEQQKN
jgi:hypothetical protein